MADSEYTKTFFVVPEDNGEISIYVLNSSHLFVEKIVSLTDSEDKRKHITSWLSACIASGLKDGSKAPRLDIFDHEKMKEENNWIWFDDDNEAFKTLFGVCYEDHFVRGSWTLNRLHFKKDEIGLASFNLGEGRLIVFHQVL